MYVNINIKTLKLIKNDSFHNFTNQSFQFSIQIIDNSFIELKQLVHILSMLISHFIQTFLIIFYNFNTIILSFVNL